MNSPLQEVLSQGGVNTSAATTNEELLSTLESWLGLPESKKWEGDTMEDVAPLDPSFYQALERWLISEWQPQSDSDIALKHSNALLEMECEPHDMSIYDAFPVVRVTRVLRLWLELNCTGGSMMAVDGGKQGVTTPLLEHCNALENGGGGKYNIYPLIAALFHHLEQLPNMRFQINFYTQALMRGEKKSTKLQMMDTKSRIHQHQEATQVAATLNDEWSEHIDALECILGEWYALANADMRRQCRSRLGVIWSNFESRTETAVSGVKMENTSSTGIKMTLKVLHRILQGVATPLQKSHELLLNHHLIPLHRPNSMVLWRDQTSLLELYHEPLVQCIATLLQKKPEWIPNTVVSLLEPDIWTKAGNTPKLVLLLHEIDAYIGVLPEPLTTKSFPSATAARLCYSLGECISSDHSRLSERALSFMKNAKFGALIKLYYELSLKILLPHLVKSELPWNPTVRKMAYVFLKKCQDIDEERFLNCSLKCFPNGESFGPDKTSLPAPRPTGKGTLKLGSAEPENEVPKDFTIKSAMGQWKPPPTGSKAPKGGGYQTAMPPPSSRVPRPGGGAPPLGVTGVAPWAMKPPGASATKNPPLSVTGVAPWAMKKSSAAALKPPTNGGALPGVSEPPPAVKDKMEKPAKSRVQSYMDKIKPAEEEEGVSVWAKEQMAESPTLLPDLKFHDLVFGHDLGEGAFGKVRYARLIDRNKTRSHWKEYAVKVISTEKIKEMGYETSVQREVAVLRMVSHPGIARLVSSFRFQDGVYLVLEYASSGDLHSVIRKNGSLDHDSTRFVMGEIVAALASVHEMGLVFADLKPENIVLTEEGHAKLTDFGGCRATSDTARKMIQDASANLLNTLRDGNWKDAPKQKKNDFDMDDDDEDVGWGEEAGQQEEKKDDLRIEGTTTYLPPEVVMGGFPTPSADSWALGCVIYQCLSGRPPVVENDESATRNRIVSFSVEEEGNDQESRLFSESYALEISSDARALIMDLLHKNDGERPSMMKVAQHEFFTKYGTDVFGLYRQPAPQLDVGNVAPQEDAKWARRQFSSIWAPQPQAYDVSLNSAGMKKRFRFALGSGIIDEGDEATAFFSAAKTSAAAGVFAPMTSLKRPIEE
ncbi:unnamed protein product [Cylindrotheca closterium]|uniref:non-specific serine/threonine protein kinase n=1 Tax=Cylindrotheca closterium TaxID=2856 RepID=A0AAD2G095_9STRA|nr:unnamed protein product [Cylindrotheca closterium]